MSIILLQSGYASILASSGLALRHVSSTLKTSLAVEHESDLIRVSRWETIPSSKARFRFSLFESKGSRIARRTVYCALFCYYDNTSRMFLTAIDPCRDILYFRTNASFSCLFGMS